MRILIVNRHVRAHRRNAQLKRRVDHLQRLAAARARHRAFVADVDHQRQTELGELFKIRHVAGQPRIQIPIVL